MKGLACLICCCLAIGAAVGYGLGMSRPGGSSVLPVQQVVPLEVYLWEQSFSEIDNTNRKLEGLAIQFLTEVRVRHMSTNGGAGSPFHGAPLYVIEPERAAHELKHGLDLFKGTGQEMRMVQELLFFLKKQKQADRWLEVYLQALYEHPTHPLIARYGQEATIFSERLGCQDQLANAFDLLSRIPPQFTQGQPLQMRIAAAGAAGTAGCPGLQNCGLELDVSAWRPAVEAREPTADRDP